MIETGFCKWSPSQDRLFQMFRHDTAFRLYRRVPITGILRRIDCDAGQFSCIGPSGKMEVYPVLISEIMPVGGVANVAE